MAGVYCTPGPPAIDTLTALADEHAHIPVLLDETLGLLDPREGEVYADATAGLGGHARAFATRLGASGTVVLNDLDPANLERAEAGVREACASAGAGCPRIVAVRGNFADLPRALVELEIAADMLLADLGFSSSQMDDPERGMSFRADGPLDMRLDPGASISAAEVVNTWPERELADLIYRLGEEPSSRKIASAIVRAREAAPITTTGRLAEVVRDAAGGGRPRRRGGKTIDPATKTFQAIRIAVNDEIGNLESLLGAIGRGASGMRAGVGRGWLSPGARVGVISFHSLEDRPVKRAFGELVSRGLVEELARGVVRPSDGEVGRNPRSRSAKLRAVRVSSGPVVAAGG